MKKVTIENARPEHYKQILELIQKYLDSEGNWERNKYLFDYSWQSMPQFSGKYSEYVMLNESGVVVGYVGYIMSKRQIGGQEVVCNSGSTLVVEPEYSIHMLKLLEPYRKKEVMRIAYSPRQNVEKLYTGRFFGMIPFLEYTRMFPRLRVLSSKKVRISDKTEDAFDVASEEEKILIEDNCKYVAETITVYTKEGNFNIIGRKFRIRVDGLFHLKISFFEVLYVGNKDLLGKYFNAALNQICKLKKVWIFLCDDRFIDCEKIPFHIKKEFKCFYTKVEGIDINPKDLDDLYSEKTLLNFYDPPKPAVVTLKRILKKEDLLEINN